MRLPKRVPWSNISELENIFIWIFGENSDSSSKRKAVNRLSAWRVSTAIPNALESTLMILSVILQDEREKFTTSLILRQSYSLALVRFVNGLVDPLQSGPFARPIMNIAAQIGLPLWLVELRHAGTHEDLPSLELLREGAKEAMLWLLYNYFLPMISPQTQPEESLKLPPLSPLLLRYKQLSKTTTRDVTLKSRSKADVSRLFREFDQWLAEANVVASKIAFHSSTREEEVEEKERWTLVQLSENLIDRGGLVPVSKKKRTLPTQGLNGPPAEYLSIWSPLLSHLQANHPTFLSILLFRILSHLFSDNSETTDGPSMGGINHSDPTYDFTLASWALWIVDNYQNNDGAAIDLNDILKELLLGFGHYYNNAAKALISELLKRHESLRDNSIILSLIKPPSHRKSTWDNNTLRIMSERLAILRPATEVLSPNVLHEDADDMIVDSENVGVDSATEDVELPGWRRLEDADEWKPVPIGAGEYSVIE
ncbi:hypothetical protein Clacol_002951 [Clathrus columnatus]|uniref:Las1-domain-containing protein n=1 Tax=Clathrus columnatus TaxID=1419009 RepID=A0AAV5A272_9AGAM|nr:hypothetical protein Clacol_002951 [Clathrus columnatus]